MSKKLVQLKNVNNEDIDPINLNYETRLTSLNNSVTNLDSNKLNHVKMSNGRYIKNVSLAYYNNKWCLKATLIIDGGEYEQYFYADAGNV